MSDNDESEMTERFDGIEMEHRFDQHDEQVDRLVWFWRLSTYKHQCGPEGCGISADPTKQKGEFCAALFEEFANKPGGFVTLIEALTVAIGKLAKASPATPPQHLWIARGVVFGCSCGWHSEASDREEAEREWVEHAGDHTLVLQDWQREYLEHVG